MQKVLLHAQLQSVHTVTDTTQETERQKANMEKLKHNSNYIILYDEGPSKTLHLEMCRVVPQITEA